MSQEAQMFYITDDETKEQYWSRKVAMRRNPATAETAKTTRSVSTNLIKQQPEIQNRLRKTNKIIIEQSKDAFLQQ